MHESRAQPTTNDDNDALETPMQAEVACTHPTCEAHAREHEHTDAGSGARNGRAHDCRGRAEVRWLCVSARRQRFAARVK